jgi:hypothetical protein
MSITSKVSDKNVFESTVSDLKEGVAYATKAQTEASEKAAKTAKDLVAFNQASIDAFNKAGKLLASGSMDMMNKMAASSQAATAECLAGLRSLVLAKTAKERFELQLSLTRATAEWALTETSKFGKASIALTEEASAPLIAHAVNIAETLTALKA